MVFETTLTQFAFDDPVYAGTSAQLGFTLGVAPNRDWEFGYSYETSFLFSPSFDGPEPEDSATTLTQLLYAKRYWQLGQGSRIFAMLGGHRVEIETSSSGLCLFFCSSPIVTRKTYDGDASGMAWGLGVIWNRSSNRQLALRYIDFDSDDGDFSSLSLVFHSGFAG